MSFCLSELLGALCCPECQTGPVSSDWEDMWMTLGFTKGPRTRLIRRVLNPELGEQRSQSDDQWLLEILVESLLRSKKSSGA